jgi:DNA-binding XRE family transcriptional regulator
MPGPPVSMVQPTQVPVQREEAGGHPAGEHLVAAVTGEGPVTAGIALADGADAQSETFAAWMSSALRREGLTQEAAARQLGVSVKTVSRWVGGATEPRMRDLRRIQEVFGEVPLP